MEPIGIIKTEFTDPENMPIQPIGAEGSTGKIILDKKYQDGLLHLEDFSHIYIIYRFHLSGGYKLRVKPFLDDEIHGVFATRAPKRPNPVGLSIVKVISVKDNIIEIEGADVIDGTPLLDIKPYVSAFDNFETSKNGWVKATAKDIQSKRSDDRFIEDRLK